MTKLSETLLILIAIMALSMLFGWLDYRDAILELAELKKQELGIKWGVCTIQQGNTIHQFQCSINGNKAELKT